LCKPRRAKWAITSLSQVALGGFWISGNVHTHNAPTFKTPLMHLELLDLLVPVVIAQQRRELHTVSLCGVRAVRAAHRRWAAVRPLDPALNLAPQPQRHVRSRCKRPRMKRAVRGDSSRPDRSAERPGELISPPHPCAPRRIGRSGGCAWVAERGPSACGTSGFGRAAGEGEILVLRCADQKGG
jgi:hypothetical protein